MKSLIPTFSGECSQTGPNSFKATGNIVAGGSETCDINNKFELTTPV